MSKVVTYTLADGRRFKVNDQYYLGSCDSCGHVGSTEDCPPDSGWGDDDVICPNPDCRRSGFDCGKLAKQASQGTTPEKEEE